MTEVFQYLPWQFFLIIAIIGILLTAIACSPTALVHWAHEYLQERKRRERIAQIEKAESRLNR
jgi:hypothetical protein